MRTVYLHPGIHGLDEMVKYLCLENVSQNLDLTWDETNPEVVIASEHIYKNPKMMKQLKRYYRQNAVMVYHAGEAAFPDLTVFDYAIAINTRLSNQDRITRIPPSKFYARSTIEDMKTNDMDESKAEELLKGKTGFCNFIYSNPVAHPMRDRLFYAISEYRLVDSLGSHLNNTKMKSTRHEKNWAVLSVRMKEPYKFTVASENALFDGYTSEKLLTSFQAHSVPIYWGNPYVAEEFNDEAFINCHKYRSVEEIVQRIKEIDENDALWTKMVSAPWQTDEQIRNTDLQMEEYERFMTRLLTSDVEGIRRRPEGTFAKIYTDWFFKSYRMKNSFFRSVMNRIKRTIRSFRK